MPSAEVVVDCLIYKGHIKEDVFKSWYLLALLRIVLLTKRKIGNVKKESYDFALVFNSLPFSFPFSLTLI